MPSRIETISARPTIRNFAQDASQSAIRPVADFLAPSVEVPTMAFRYKKYDAKHRFKRINTKRGSDGKATRLTFTATDGNGTLEANALDFPIPNLESIEEAELTNRVQEGITLLADASGLNHEGETLDAALDALGAGTDMDLTDANLDVIAYLDGVTQQIMKAARNGAPVRYLFGTGAFIALRNHKSVRGRFTTGVRNGLVTPTEADLSALLFGNPQVRTSLLVEDRAAEGLDADIQFLLDNAFIAFAANDAPNRYSPDFMKSFRLMGKWMTPGQYLSEDERDQVLKMDWNELVAVTNPTAGKRFNTHS